MTDHSAICPRCRCQLLSDGMCPVCVDPLTRTIRHLLQAEERGEIILNCDGEPCCPHCGYYVHKCKCGVNYDY